MKKIIKWIGIIVGVWIFAAIAWNLINSDSSGDTNLISIVKTGNLTACPSFTVEQLANNFIGSPTWEGGTLSEDNKTKFVNIRGKITFQDKPVNAAIQFQVDENNGTFQFRAFELNEIPQNKLLQIGLIQKMCEASTEKGN